MKQRQQRRRQQQMLMLLMSLVQLLLWDLQARRHTPQLRHLTQTWLLLLLVVVMLRLQQVSTEAKSAGPLNHCLQL
jgi:hypothetical protein